MTVTMSDNNSAPTQKPAKIHFSNEFTQKAKEYREANPHGTVAQFGQTLNVNIETLWGWANKKKKDENGNLTEQLARPSFHAELTKIAQLPPKPKEKKLNERQELFCQLYSTIDTFFGNGVEAYIEAYNIDVSKKGAYDGARASASRLLTDANVLKRIDELLELGGLNDQFVDKQLQFVIQQNADMASKVAGIREYNKLKSRITSKLDLTTKGKALPTPIYGGKSISK